MAMEAPHKIAGRGAHRVVHEAKGLGHKGVAILDKPLDKLGAPEGPHHIVSNVADAVADAANDLVRKVTGA